MEDYGKKETETILLQKFLEKLNKDPNPAELEKTPDGKANSLPISFVEMTLDELYFGMWETPNFKWSAITNEVQGSIELVVTHPVTGLKITRTGAASVIIMVDSLDQETRDAMSKQDRNLYALNPENKKPNALDLAFPKLKAECIKNAAQSLGKIFGRDINRKKKDVYKPSKRALNNEEFMALNKRVANGELQLLPIAEDHFILDELQKDFLNSTASDYRASKQLSNGTV